MLTLSNADVLALANSVDASVANALNGSLAWWKSGAPRSEPEAVAAVVSAGLPYAAAGWTATLARYGYNVKIVGVFSHCTPQVEFKNASGVQQRPCELADILVVIDMGAASPPLDRRALLIQAKMAKYPRKSLAGTELTQLDLYQRYPDFRFKYQPYPSNQRNIQRGPGRPSEGFAYGLIDLALSAPVWEQMAPANPLVMGSGCSLGTILAGMAVGMAGRKAIPSGSDGWSDTVELLLTITYNAMARGSFGGNQRGVMTLAFVDEDFSVFRSGPILQPPTGAAREGSDPGPISIVHITISPFPEPTGERSER